MASFKYFNPKSLKCPKEYVKDVRVLYDGTSMGGEDYSLALLKWKDEWTLGIRWNRSMKEACDQDKMSGAKMCMGVPISFAHPVWFVIPWELQKIILNNPPTTWNINQQEQDIIDQIKNAIDS